MSNRITQLKAVTEAARNQLYDHPIYAELKSVAAIRVFMKFHAFAVWDFMSLVKSLQAFYTPTTTPWYPPASNSIARFVNEIVLGEESDVNADGGHISHFEMYLEAMKDIKANTSLIETFLSSVRSVDNIEEAIRTSDLPPELQDFLSFTFTITASQEIHKVAAVFSFGREDIIPEMFHQIISQTEISPKPEKLFYYLSRHIELDGDEHGPMALKIVEDACGSDEKKWREATEAAKKAIELRINLWSMILGEFSNH